MKQFVKEFGRLLRGALPFYVVNNQPKNLLENILSYNSNAGLTNSDTFIGEQGVSNFGGKLGVNNTNPTFELDVTGDVNYTGSLYIGGQLAIFSNWVNSGADLYRDSSVAIGKASAPAYTLDVDGSVNVEGQFRTAMTVASPMLVEVTAGTYWSLGWWNAADGSWWLLGKMSEVASFTRADAEFYVPLGMIADVPSS